MTQHVGLLSKIDFRMGLRDSIPICIAFIMVSLPVGMLSHHAGLTWLQTAVSGLLIYATPLQLVQLHFLQQSHALGLFFLITITVNCRFFLMSATLAPYFSVRPLWQLFISAPLISASSFTVTHVKITHAKPTDCFSYFLGVGLLSYIVSFIALMIGYSMNTLFTSPLVNLFFVMMLPIHFSVLTAMRWPKISEILATVSGFLAMPFLLMLFKQYTLLVVPVLIGAVCAIIFNVFKRGSHV